MKDQNLENFINDVLNESNGMDSYEVDHLSAVRSVIATHPSVTNKSEVLAAIDNKIRYKQGNKQATSYRADELNSVADFSITCTRLTNTIAQSLPVPLFSPISAEGGYSEILGSLLGAGTTITSVLYGTNAALPTMLQITYANGGNSDIIEVTCNTMHYPSFLKDCNNNRFILDRSRLSVSRVANALAQFNVTMQPYTQTLFGSTTFNRISLGANITPEQFQTGIIDVPKTLEIEPNKGVVIPFVVSQNGDSFTITGFVTALRRG